MWKAILTFVTQRLILLVVAFAALNQAIPAARRPGSVLPQVNPTSVLWSRLLDRVAEEPEAQALNRLMLLPKTSVFGATHNPFLWICRWAAGLSQQSPLVTLIVISNLFLLLFLWELNALFNRMATPETAASATMLVVLWPTTYEMSLGSTLAMTCFFIAMSIRHALDNRWLVTGLAMGGLALIEPLVLGLLPLILYLFWYFQRHFPAGEVVKRSLYFLIPAGLAIGWRIHSYAHLSTMMHQSAFFNLASTVKGIGPGVALSRTYIGQTVAILFFTVGAVAAFLSNTTLIHRLIPVNMLVLLLLFSPFGSLASRAPIAAVCLEGIASASSRATARIVALVMLTLSAYEVFTVFY